MGPEAADGPATVRSRAVEGSCANPFESGLGEIPKTGRTAVAAMRVATANP
jgi:hypothetical protein